MTNAATCFGWMMELNDDQTRLETERREMIRDVERYEVDETGVLEIDGVTYEVDDGLDTSRGIVWNTLTSVGIWLVIGSVVWACAQ